MLQPTVPARLPFWTPPFLGLDVGRSSPAQRGSSSLISPSAMLLLLPAFLAMISPMYNLYNL